MDDPGSERRRSVEYLKCMASPGYFIHHFCVIDDTQGKGDEAGGSMPFRLWPAQKRLLLGIGANLLVFILKARQLGISWLVCGYALWLVLFQEGKLVLLLSQGEAEAIELLRRIVAMYHRLPPWLAEYLPRSIPPTNTTVFTLDNGSVVRSLPATKKAGRSYTASLVIMDEFAQLPWPEETMKAIKPTVDAGGQLVILSTADGVGNLFHDLWVKFSTGLTRWRTFFLSWRDRPERDQAWYDRTLAESNDPAGHKQEYPDSPSEAFQASGRVRFDQEWIERQERNIVPPSSPPKPLAVIPGISFYEPPALSLSYVVTGDPAEGLDNGDFSAGLVACLQTGAEVASHHDHCEPDEFASRLFRVACYYNAPIVVERNNHGHAVIQRLGQLISEAAEAGSLPPSVRIFRGPDGKRGWPNTTKSKPLAVDLLAQSLREGSIVVRSRGGLTELQTYSVLSGGKTGAPAGKHDDRVTAWFLFCATRSTIVAQSGPRAY